MRVVATIGVYGSTVESFLSRLRSHQVRSLVDVRQRRAVRGSQYSWANSRRLQECLRQAGIGYLHCRELAPTTELRQLQYEDDRRRGVGKRNRAELAQEYRARYTSEILDRADLAAFVAALPDNAVSALLCVEADAAACHRSLIAERLHWQLGIRTLDI